MIFAGILGSSNERKSEILLSIKKLLNSLNLTNIQEITYKEMIVYTECSLPVVKSNNRPDSSIKILMGDCYNKNHAPINANELEQINNNNLAEFFSNFWGGYLLISSDPAKQVFHILRDPTGKLPLYFARIESTIIFTSRNFIIRHFMSSVTFNLEYLCSYLERGTLTTMETPFEGIYELPPGCILTLSKDKQDISFVFAPKYDQKKYQSNTYQKITDTLGMTIKTKLKNFEEIQLEFSGGLDSASILYCLKPYLDNNQVLQLVNFYHPLVESMNEIEYAKNIAKEVGAELTLFDLSESVSFSAINDPNFRPNKPSPSFINFALEKNLASLLRRDGKKLYISGHGGDHSFMAPPSKSSMIDLIIERNFKLLKPTLAFFSEYFFDNYINLTLKLSTDFFKYLINYNNHFNIKQEVAPWIKREVKNFENKYLVHILHTQKRKRILPGKVHQLNSIYQALSDINDDVGCYVKNDVFYPFLSQPMIELAVSIPTYQLFQNGIDRYPVRKAISEKFKTNSVWRKSKGTSAGIFELGLNKHKDFIISLCMEGFMASNNLIDKDILYKNILNMTYGQNDYKWKLIYLISLELFCETLKNQM